MEVLEEIIINYCDDSKYFIIFDELDEDYKDFPSPEEKEKYMSMLTSLFKAVQDIISISDSYDKHILPVVFLRSDIYDLIKDSDKNKWNESVINLEWDTTQIKRMLAHRICVAINENDLPFEEAWNILFKDQPIRMGHRKNIKMELYNFIERSTEMRPRDFIKYIKECVILANNRSEKRISPQIVKDADDNFSEYLKDETIDEVYAVLPEINEILGLLSTIRKQSFQFDDFEMEYNNLINRGVVQKRDVRQILLILFNVGVIGNEPLMKGQTIFSFSKKRPRFNYTETIRVHRGLFKALQIF